MILLRIFSRHSEACQVLTIGWVFMLLFFFYSRKLSTVWWGRNIREQPFGKWILEKRHPNQISNLWYLSIFGSTFAWFLHAPKLLTQFNKIIARKLFTVAIYFFAVILFRIGIACMTYSSLQSHIFVPSYFIHWCIRKRTLVMYTLIITMATTITLLHFHLSLFVPIMNINISNTVSNHLNKLTTSNCCMQFDMWCAIQSIARFTLFIYIYEYTVSECKR